MAEAARLLASALARTTSDKATSFVNLGTPLGSPPSTAKICQKIEVNQKLAEADGGKVKIPAWVIARCIAGLAIAVPVSRCNVKIMRWIQ